jgi:beta-alanine degradation protein BauB
MVYQELDALQAAPENYYLALENDKVRAFNVHFNPGEKTPMHTHPNHVIFPLNDGRMRITNPDGSSRDMELKAQQAAWSKPETHTAENIGANEMSMFVVELRD